MLKNASNNELNNHSNNPLEKAKALELPSRNAVLNREFSVQQFWEGNRNLLENAWAQWDQQSESSELIPDESLLDSNLVNAINNAWESPETELEVRKLIQEVSPGVFKLQMFDPEKLIKLREYLENIADSGIPTKAPYGIALNRYGAMLDARSEGYIAAPSFQEFYQKIMDKYLRPIGRLLFPEIMGYDSQTFGFSIKYQPGVDTSLRMHTDASAVTLNVNLNLPDEEFEGSEVDFHDYSTGQMNRIKFESGVAMIHRGNIAHAAQPIKSGERTNFVFWLYGKGGQIPNQNWDRKEINAKDRWVHQEVEQDKLSPF